MYVELHVQYTDTFTAIDIYISLLKLIKTERDFKIF